MVSKTNKFYFNCTSYKLVPVCTVLLVISAERFSTEISDQNLQVPDSQHWWKLQDFDITIERERGQRLNKKLICHTMSSGDLKKHDFSCRGQKKALDDDMAQISNKISLLSGPDKNPCEGLKWVFSLYGGQNVWDSRFVPPTRYTSHMSVYLYNTVYIAGIWVSQCDPDPRVQIMMTQQVKYQLKINQNILVEWMLFIKRQ